MNINEVIVNWVIEIVGGKMGSKNLIYFNDYVNMLQLFNDIFFIVMYIFLVVVLYKQLLLKVKKIWDVF